jgi:acetyltransferase
MFGELPRDYPRKYEGWTTIRDGSEVFLRPIKPTDGPLLVEGFRKLSPRSIYLRFLSPLRHLPEKWVHQFTHVDYRNDFALVATIHERGLESIIAVGRYAHNPSTGRAEVAIVVRDDWQRRGLGKAILLKLMEIARENKVTRFEAFVDRDNVIVMRLISALGALYRVEPEEGLYHVEMDI